MYGCDGFVCKYVFKALHLPLVYLNKLCFRKKTKKKVIPVFVRIFAHFAASATFGRRRRSSKMKIDTSLSPPVQRPARTVAAKALYK